MALNVGFLLSLGAFSVLLPVSITAEAGWRLQRITPSPDSFSSKEDVGFLPSAENEVTPLPTSPLVSSEEEFGTKVYRIDKVQPV